MSERQLFCWSGNYGNELSAHQKEYRLFNKEVGKKRWREAYKQVVTIFEQPNLKLVDFWKNVTPKQIAQLMKLPEFDKEGFEFISGRKLEEFVTTSNTLSGKRVKVIIDGKEWTATVD